MRFSRSQRPSRGLNSGKGFFPPYRPKRSVIAAAARIWLNGQQKISRGSRVAEENEQDTGAEVSGAAGSGVTAALPLVRHRNSPFELTEE